MKKFLLVLVFALFATSCLVPATTHASLTYGSSNSATTGTGLAKGLVAYYTFDGKDVNWGTNKANDIAGGNTGTLTNMSTTTSPVQGKIGQGLKFNGANYVNVPSFAITGEASCSAWIYPTFFNGQQKHIFDDINNTGNGQLGCEIDRTSTKMSMTWKGTIVVTGNTALQLNKWSYVTWVRSGTAGNWTAKVYINGVLDNSGTTANNPDTSVGNFGIGSSPNTTGPSFFYTGLIDDVRVYNRALSVQEIQQLYKMGVARVATSPTLSLASGLVGYWTFDGKNLISNATDSSGQGNNGFLQGFTSTTTVSGKIGQALSFNAASSQRVSTTNVVNSIKVTVSAWVYLTAYPGSNAFIAGFSNGGGGGQYNKDLYIDSAGKIYFSTYDGNTKTTSAPVNPIPLNTWTHVVGTTDASNNYAYMNGVQVGSVAAGNSEVGYTLPDIFIGGGLNVYAYITAKIDDVRVYNRALSAQEVAQLYKQGGGVTAVSSNSAATGTGLTKGLTAYWTFDGPSVSWTTGKITDVSGNGNTGTLTSMSTTSSPIVGKIGQALKFNGTAGEITTTTNYGNATTFSKLSISVWFKTSVASGKPIIGIYDNQTGQSGSEYDRILYVDTGGSVRFYAYDGGAKYAVSTTATYADGKWHHAVATETSGSNITLYVDGVLQQITGFGTQFSYTGNNSWWRIGAYLNGTETLGANGYFPGTIDDVRIYNRALSYQEIQQLYKMGK